MRPVNEIVVHCADTRPAWMSDASPEEQTEEIRRWHTSPGWQGSPDGWSDIGYHYVVARNGKVVPGRPLGRVGAHVKGRNTGTIGICLLGGHGAAATDRFEDHFTPEQDRALRNLIHDLKYRFPNKLHLSGHNEYAAKGCPGFHVRDWFNRPVNNPPVTVPPSPPIRPVPNPVERLFQTLLRLFRRDG